MPALFNEKPINKIVIEKQSVFDLKAETKEVVHEDFTLTSEYAWSGWFKWTPCAQEVWHLAVRLSIH